MLIENPQKMEMQSAWFLVWLQVYYNIYYIV